MPMKSVIVNVYKSDTDYAHPYYEINRVLRKDKNAGSRSPYYVMFNGLKYYVYPSRKAYYKGRYDLFMYGKNSIKKY